jgi:hypothetical protein
MQKSRRNNRRRVQRRTRGGFLANLLNSAPAVNGSAGLSTVLPTTDWGRWSSTPAATQWGPQTSAPAALANGGLYTNPQSTAPWASSPFPATQYAMSVEAAKVSGLPEVAYHQRPNDNYGSSYSPVVTSPITPNHYSVSGPAGPIKVSGGGRRSRTRSSRKTRKTRRSRSNKARY